MTDQFKYAVEVLGREAVRLKLRIDRGERMYVMSRSDINKMRISVIIAKDRNKLASLEAAIQKLEED